MFVDLRQHLSYAATSSVNWFSVSGEPLVIADTAADTVSMLDCRVLSAAIRASSSASMFRSRTASPAIRAGFLRRLRLVVTDDQIHPKMILYRSVTVENPLPQPHVQSQRLLRLSLQRHPRYDHQFLTQRYLNAVGLAPT